MAYNITIFIWNFLEFSLTFLSLNTFAFLVDSYILCTGSGKMAEEKYNMKNSAVKRILQEVKEMQSSPSPEYMSLPLEVLMILPSCYTSF
jgi:hypothetical protein